MKLKKYIIIVADRKHTILFSLLGSSVERFEKLENADYLPLMKHRDDNWGAQDLIDNHKQDQLSKHLSFVSDKITEFIAHERIDGVMIGGRRTLFTQIIKHLTPSLQKNVKGTFVTELKVPFNSIYQRALIAIQAMDDKELQGHNLLS
ncbi:hypothetical protein BH09PAT1_BH09PAT1_7190 [soil metagenome]